MSTNKPTIILEHFKYVVERIDGLYFIKDILGRYLVVSQGLSQFSNISSESIIGKLDCELPWNKLAARFVNDDQLVIQTKRKHVSKYLFEIHNGHYKTIKTTKEPIFDDDNNVIGIFASIEIVLLPLEELLHFDRNIEFVGGENSNIRLTNLEIKLFFFIISQAPCRISNLLIFLPVGASDSHLCYIVEQLKLKIQQLTSSDLEFLYRILGFDYVDSEVASRLLINSVLSLS